MGKDGLPRYWDLLKQSWRDFWELRGVLIFLSVLGMLPELLGSFLLSVAREAGVLSWDFWAARGGWVYLVLAIIFSLGFMAVGFVWTLWMEAGVYVAIRDKKTTAKMSNLRVGEMLQKAKPYVFKLWWAGILGGLCVMGAAFPLIIPAPFVGALVAFSGMAVVYEGYSGFGALERSRELVKGRFWHVMALLLGYFGVVAVLSVVVFGGNVSDSAVLQVISGMVQWIVGLWSVTYLARFYEALAERPIKKEKAEKSVFRVLAIWGAVVFLFLAITGMWVIANHEKVFKEKGVPDPFEQLRNENQGEGFV